MSQVNPSLAAVHSLLAAQGLRPPFNLPSAMANARNQANSVNETPSRDSNSSAEDSGQFSPGEIKKTPLDFAHLANKTQSGPKMALGSMLDMNMNMKSMQPVANPAIPNLPGPLGEAMKFIQQRMAAVSRLEAEKRRRDELADE